MRDGVVDLGSVTQPCNHSIMIFSFVFDLHSAVNLVDAIANENLRGCFAIPTQSVTNFLCGSAGCGGEGRLLGCHRNQALVFQFTALCQGGIRLQ
jgi:hypothetical protein